MKEQKINKAVKKLFPTSLHSMVELNDMNKQVESIDIRFSEEEMVDFEGVGKFIDEMHKQCDEDGYGNITEMTMEYMMTACIDEENDIYEGRLLFYFTIDS